MTNQEELDYLISCNYTPEYICLCYIFNGDYYLNWFTKLISTGKKYRAYREAMKPDLVEKFLKTMNDDKVNLSKYFKMNKVMERADRYKVLEHKVKVYANVMKVDISLAYHLYSLDAKAAEDDLWDTVYKNTLGEDYKEKYPISCKKAYAYFINDNGVLRDLRRDRSSKMQYIYGIGAIHR